MSLTRACLLSVLGLALAPLGWAGTWGVDEVGGKRPDVPSQVIFTSRPPSSCVKEITNEGPGSVLVEVEMPWGTRRIHLGPGSSVNVSEASCSEVSITIIDAERGEDRASGKH